ncbi:MAG: MAPEG family protein [Gammaproteobacteria bacterium]
MNVPVTAFYAAIFGIALIALSWRVVLARRGVKVGVGFGGNEQLAQVCRVQANFVEYVPFALFLMVLYELNGGSREILHGAGFTLLVARALHSWGLSHKPGISFGRVWGTTFTWLVIIVLSGANLYRLVVPG